MKLTKHKKLAIKLWLMSTLLLAGIIGTQAQTTPIGPDAQPSPTPSNVSLRCQAVPDSPECVKVQVTQGFVDDATKAFKTVVAQRDAINKLLEERVLSAAEREAWGKLRDALNEVITFKDRVIQAQGDLIATYQKVIKLQDEMIDKLYKQLNKPKSIFSRIMNTLKEIALVVGGILVGRGL